METVKFGIIGLGNMGLLHARNFQEGRCGPAARLAAVCDRNREVLDRFSDLATFADAAELIRAPEVDAVIIATQHVSHPELGIAALEAGKHILVEKPLAVDAAAARELLAVARTRPDRVCGAVFNQRTDPRFQRLKAMVDGGELGRVQRIQWTITDWFRTQAYYESSYWRGTWAGEGGGLLINQCPHNLDLLTWIFGSPARVRAFARIGGFHDIEVEDTINAYLEFPDGATALFSATTGEAPGVNRLEVAGDQGLVVIEPGRFSWSRNRQSAADCIRRSESGFTRPETETHELTFEGPPPHHAAVIANFADAVLHGAPLIAPLASGLPSLELGNAMLLSHFQDRTVDLPLDADAFRELLGKKMKTSVVPPKGKKKPPPADFDKSF